MFFPKGWAGNGLVGVAALLAGIGAAAACAGEESAPGSGGAGADGGATDGAALDGAVVEPSTDGGRDDFAEPIVDQGAPANAAQIFAAADVAGEGPCLSEPQVGSLIPKNWQRLRFRQHPAQAENLFEIRLTVPSQKSALFIYTTKSDYTLDAQTWGVIRTYGVGSVGVRVRSVRLDGQGAVAGGPWKGADGSIEIAPVDARGTLSYFANDDGAVKRLRVGDESVALGPTPANAGSACIGCHTPTPDGAHAALTTDASTGGLTLRPLAGGASAPAFLSASAQTLLARSDQFTAAFSKAHWSAGDRVLVSVFKVNAASEIVWTDLEAGSTAEGSGWGVVARTGDANSAGSPALSHDGTKVAYVSSATTTTGTVATSGRIAVVPWNARQGGPAVFLTGASSSTAVQYYPSFSADDALVAFDKIDSGTTYFNAAAEIFVVPATGAAAPHRLAANDPPSCLGKTTPGVTNSWPRWSPEVQEQGKKKYYFLTFSSRRVGDKAQIFVAPVVVEGGAITSYPALYSWAQAEAVENHTPSWSEPL